MEDSYIPFANITSSFPWCLSEGRTISLAEEETEEDFETVSEMFGEGTF